MILRLLYFYLATITTLVSYGASNEPVETYRRESQVAMVVTPKIDSFLEIGQIQLASLNWVSHHKI